MADMTDSPLDTRPIALVTGAASGIGAAIAQTLHARGIRIACVDRDASGAAAMAATLDGSAAFAVDVTDAAAVDALLPRIVEELGVPSIVVCSAGIEVVGRADELDAARFTASLDVNVTGSFLVASAAARALIERALPGRIVLVASVNGMKVSPNQAAYAASKGAVIALTKSLAVDWAPLGIAVNAVAPGVTDTAMSAGSLGDPVKRAALLAGVPMDRPAQPSEIADAVAFLASEQASYITGVVLPVDGGWMARA
jgi:NAD(P)-dependent dehydrogenase (short-subunit alcohol dehydrogenase family)